MSDFASVVEFIRSQFPRSDTVPLHAPSFGPEERHNLLECLDSTMVSTIGPFVDRFESEVARLSGRRYGIAVINGTVALQMALRAAGVKEGDEVLTQPLTFVATANAIVHSGAHPVFIDVERESLGLDPDSLQLYLERNSEVIQGRRVSKQTGRRIAACVPVHVFGHPCRIDRIAEICSAFAIPLVEDAAEALGSTYLGRPCGSFGSLAAFSFNGNKIVTAGGGGVVVTDDESCAKWLKHITTVAKIPHPWEYDHDEVGFNYRLPNINAALVVGQLSRFAEILVKKRHLAQNYLDFFTGLGMAGVREPDGARSNYWLNSLLTKNVGERDQMLKTMVDHGVMGRPAWRLMHKLPMYASSPRSSLTNAEWLEERLVALPSSTPLSN